MRIAGETNVDKMPRAQLSVDEVANTLSFLTLGEIMPLRCVNMTWKDAAKKTIVPPTDFRVNNERRYNAMGVMARVLPNVQQISLQHFRCRHKWSDGEDPDEEHAAMTADYTTHDIEIISNFSKLRILGIDSAGLNGRYPVLFNSFPLLQKLYVDGSYGLKWDLEMLAGLPSLKELECSDSACLSSNINSLRVLKDVLEKVKINDCDRVEGNFMDLADFPHLKILDLDYTAVTGDISDIGVNDFSSLESLRLPKGVYGGDGYELQRISDGPDLMRAVHLLRKQRPALKMQDWYVSLSQDSPDWYELIDMDYPPPFYIRLVEAGPRLGYRWIALSGRSRCELTNWLDPEPDRESSGYAKYIEAWLEILESEEGVVYGGFHQPPTEDEYNQIVIPLMEARARFHE